jgi:sulfoxide reductase heme-binding subunit YedZ
LLAVLTAPRETACKHAGYTKIDMKDARFAKFVVFVNSAVPLAMLCWDAYRHRLGADPVSFVINTTGMLTLVFLMLSLTVTPARLVSGWNWLSHFRRMLGLYAFFYGVVHLTTYFVFDRSFSFRDTVSDVAKRPFILVGMTALLLMVPLAITSTNGMIKRLGANRWKQLHRFVYVSAILGVIHYYLRVKADIRQPVAFAIVLGALLAYRLLLPYLPFLKRTKKPAPRGFPVQVG